MPNRQTTEQERAKSAWKDVEEIDRKGYKKEYGSQARGLPAMIQTNGLGQTLAFLKAKGKNEDNAYKGLYTHLNRWTFARLTGDNTEKPLPGTRGGDRQPLQSRDLLEWLIHHDSALYRRATNEALAYALWLRRFAEAKGWGDGSDEGGGT